MSDLHTTAAANDEPDELSTSLAYHFEPIDNLSAAPDVFRGHKEAASAGRQDSAGSPQDSSPPGRRRAAGGGLVYLGMAIIAACSFMAGRSTVMPRDKVAIAEKSGLVLEALLSHPSSTPEEIDAQLRRPILGVFNKYAALGYTVIDAGKDEQGNLAVVAVPANAIDITPELRAAVKNAGGNVEPAALPKSDSLLGLGAKAAIPLDAQIRTQADAQTDTVPEAPVNDKRKDLSQ
jgi:hypothetical protein